MRAGSMAILPLDAINFTGLLHAFEKLKLGSATTTDKSNTPVAQSTDVTIT